MESLDAPTLYPTEEEFADLGAYVASILPTVAPYGICKIVPPAAWPRPSAQLPSRFLIKAPVLQHISGEFGCYDVTKEERLRMTLERFERQAVAIKERERIGRQDEDTLAERFWADCVGSRPVLSATDIEGTLFPNPSDASTWNMRALPDMLRTGPTALDSEVRGVSSTVLTFGQWRSVTPLRTEERDLLSLHYLQ